VSRKWKKDKKEEDGLDLSNPETELPEPPAPNQITAGGIPQWQQKVLERLTNKPWIAFKEECTGPQGTVYTTSTGNVIQTWVPDPYSTPGEVVFTITVPIQ
jgi:hypothetical protein